MPLIRSRSRAHSIPWTREREGIIVVWVWVILYTLHTKSPRKFKYIKYILSDCVHYLENQRPQRLSPQIQMTNINPSWVPEWGLGLLDRLLDFLSLELWGWLYALGPDRSLGKFSHPREKCRTWCPALLRSRNGSRPPDRMWWSPFASRRSHPGGWWCTSCHHAFIYHWFLPFYIIIGYPRF